jgi:acetyltransferase-like isoleucine patch superfamily enzyme
MPNPPGRPPFDAAALLLAHPAWPAGLTSDQGWSAPAIATPIEIPVEEAQRQLLEAAGLTLRKPPGPGHRVVLDATTPRQRLALDLSRARDCTILLGPTARTAGSVVAGGVGHLLVIAGQSGQGAAHIHCTFRGDRALVLLGRDVSSRGVNLLAEGPEGAILIGDDAMISIGISIRTSDSHAILDIATRSQINPPQRVVIGPHVWLAEDALVMKGVRIGAGAIVGARSLVTRDVAPRSLVAGSPARMLREQVTWTRGARPDAEAIEAALRSLPPGA